jgi:alcohol dehydrogenase (cytochrome c)
MTYAVNGKQYVAVLIGADNPIKDVILKRPELKDMQNTSMLYVFGL